MWRRPDIAVIVAAKFAFRIGTVERGVNSPSGVEGATKSMSSSPIVATNSSSFHFAFTGPSSMSSAVSGLPSGHWHRQRPQIGSNPCMWLTAKVESGVCGETFR